MNSLILRRIDSSNLLLQIFYACVMIMKIVANIIACTIHNICVKKNIRMILIFQEIFLELFKFCHKPCSCRGESCLSNTFGRYAETSFDVSIHDNTKKSTAHQIAFSHRKFNKIRISKWCEPMIFL